MIEPSELLESFLGLLRIDSPSREEQEVAGHLARRLSEMGLDVEADAIGNVIARLAGEGEPLLLLHGFS